MEEWMEQSNHSLKQIFFLFFLNFFFKLVRYHYDVYLLYEKDFFLKRKYRDEEQTKAMSFLAPTEGLGFF